MLNEGYRVLNELLDSATRWSPASNADVVVGIVDADGASSRTR